MRHKISRWRTPKITDRKVRFNIPFVGAVGLKFGGRQRMSRKAQVEKLKGQHDEHEEVLQGRHAGEGEGSSWYVAWKMKREEEGKKETTEARWFYKLKR